MTFSVEIRKFDDKPDEVECYINKENLQYLIQQLSIIKDGNPGDHIHFMSEDWGGGDLTLKIHDKENMPVHHFQIIIVE